MTKFAFGEFTDFKGEIHKFVIAAVVRKCHPHTYLETYDYSGDIMYGDKEMEKFMSIGLSICNPEDKYNEKIGMLRAEGRALKPRKPENVRQMACTKGGMLDDVYVELYLETMKNYIIKDPGKFIPGYNRLCKKWIEQQSQEQSAS